MAPGINDGPRYTGTVPKSNRRNDRNRERSNSNSHQTAARSGFQHDVLQQSNNLLDWQLVIDTQRSAKNSNTRSSSSAPSVGYQDFAEFDCGEQRNCYTVDERCHWQRMAPPDTHGQQTTAVSQANKPNNVDKMPDRSQVESRLNQIRDYIRVTTTMMESLNCSTDPRAAAQRDRLCIMVEDLYDSEKKLAKLLETYRGISDEYGDQHVPSDQFRRFNDLLDVLTLQERFISDNSRCMNGDDQGDAAREAQLHQKVEETQQKLAQLQEQEASLLEMQVRARERLNEARQAQQVFLHRDEENNCGWEASGRQQSSPARQNPDQLESEQVVLRGKLAQLQTKKKRMDHLIAELQAVDASDRGSCSSENSRPAERDKVAELDAMKAQLARLKALMEEVTRDRDPSDSEVETDEEATSQLTRNSVDRQNETDDSVRKNSRVSAERPTVDQVQAVTRELKEQSQLLQAARAELQRLKPMTSTAGVTSSPVPPVLGVSEKKQTNHTSNNNANDERCDLQLAQAKRRQLEELMRKEQGHSSSVNQDVGHGDWIGVRDSNSQTSHVGVAANLWPSPAPNVESNDQSVDGASTSENLLDVGVNGNGTGSTGNWWGIPPPLGIVEQPHQAGSVGSAEYYRQLLLGSQAQQLQMMGMTMQQCCQLLWSQQRELQSMRGAIIQLQQQLQRQALLQTRPSPSHTASTPGHDQEYSNLGRTAHHNGNSLDMSLPPSSSLPNLVALPTPVPVTIANPPHQRQQQLNNQVPPGNRANNYWDNFRSYSRQNLLSVSGKSSSDRNPRGTTSTPSVNTASQSSSTATIRGNDTRLASRKEKRNREHGAEISSTPMSFQQAETSHARSSVNNVLSSDIASQQQQIDHFFDEPHSNSASYRSLPSNNEDQTLLRQLSNDMREAVSALVSVKSATPEYLLTVLREIKMICEDHRLRPRLLGSLYALRDSHPLIGWLQNETTDQTASESCRSSDDDSDMGTPNNVDTNGANRSSQASSLPAPPLPPPPIPSLPLPLVPVVSVFENLANFQAESTNGGDPSAPITPGYNEDLAEADQSRPEASHDHQGATAGTKADEDDLADTASALIADLVAQLESSDETEERNEDVGLDRVPTRLYHQTNESP